MHRLSPAIERISESATVAIWGKAIAMRRDGIDVISLSGGEPDFDTPEHIKAAAVSAIQAGDTKYTAVDGTAALKAAIARKFLRENGLEYSAQEISVGAGGKQVIFNAFAATLRPGDEVIIPRPCWVSYPDIVSFNGGTPVFVNGEEARQFKPNAAQFAAAINERTRWVVLNSPCNPTGAVFSRAELEDIGEVLKANPHVMVLADDIYEHLVYGEDPFSTIAEVVPDLKERTLTVNGVSKAYCMTGWRIGYAGGPAWLVKAMAKLQGQTTNNPASVSQAAAVAALDGPRDFMEGHRRRYIERRDLAAGLLGAIHGLRVLPSSGAFYLYVSIEGLVGKKTPVGKLIDSDVAFAQYILDDGLVALVPGSGFGMSPYIRVAYVTSDQQLREACRRIQAFCVNLH